MPSCSSSSYGLGNIDWLASRSASSRTFTPSVIRNGEMADSLRLCVHVGNYSALSLRAEESSLAPDTRKAEDLREALFFQLLPITPFEGYAKTKHYGGKTAISQEGSWRRSQLNHIGVGTLKLSAKSKGHGHEISERSHRSNKTGVEYRLQGT
jgi:hypothetical protein